ncbi:hypothetical protein HYFRA_00005572 [Hymenoscyphus fraxineus]|uniref:Uncharacterized protein n=1 Tax=Hymenoscyphus fraxineus TaxID=746836 RepID=A0A9N9PQ74_9HELO|nr:hypothetical protein HYFRA_00005572 [Hymenoscyphus fraxineus]
MAPAPQGANIQQVDQVSSARGVLDFRKISKLLHVCLDERPFLVSMPLIPQGKGNKHFAANHGISEAMVNHVLGA